MVVPAAMETLTKRASFLREVHRDHQAATRRSFSTLDSINSRLSSLRDFIRPAEEVTASIRKAEGNIDKALKAATEISDLFHLTTQAEAKLQKRPREDIDSYVEAVDQLRSILKNKNESPKYCEFLTRANSLLAKAVLKMEEDFKDQLLLNSKPVESDHFLDCQAKSLEADTYTTPALRSPEILSLLHKLAQQLVQAGHEQDCLNIVGQVRASLLEESLRNLGVGKLSSGDGQTMQLEDLHARITYWNWFMQISVKQLFASERKVCEQIFEDIDTLSDQSFAKVSSSSMALLLSFGEAIAESNLSPRKLFVLADMYDVMRDLQSEIEIIFKGKACSEVRESACKLRNTLAVTAHKTLCAFEKAVEADVIRLSIFDGHTHHLTRYVVKYVKYISDYRSTLKQIFQESETVGEANAQLVTTTLRIMQTLQSKLDGLSKQYKDPAMAYLFLINNYYNMVRSLQRTEAKNLLGDDWILRQRRIVQQNGNQYRRVAWSKVIQSLSDQGLPASRDEVDKLFRYIESSSSEDLSASGRNELGIDGVPKDESRIPTDESRVTKDGSQVSKVESRVTKDELRTIKARLKSFNMNLEKLKQRQSEWPVCGAELRESLRLSIAEIVVPAYKSFIERYGKFIEEDKYQNYIKYTPEEVGRIVREMFRGEDELIIPAIEDMHLVASSV